MLSEFSRQHRHDLLHHHHSAQEKPFQPPQFEMQNETAASARCSLQMSSSSSSSSTTLSSPPPLSFCSSSSSSTRTHKRTSSLELAEILNNQASDEDPYQSVCPFSINAMSIAINHNRIETARQDFANRECSTSEHDQGMVMDCDYDDSNGSKSNGSSASDCNSPVSAISQQQQQQQQRTFLSENQGELWIKPSRKNFGIFLHEFPARLYSSPFKYEVMMRWSNANYPNRTENPRVTVELRMADTNEKVEPLGEGESYPVTIESAVKTCHMSSVSESSFRIRFNVVSFKFNKRAFVLRVALAVPTSGAIIACAESNSFQLYARKTDKDDNMWQYYAQNSKDESVIATAAAVTKAATLVLGSPSAVVSSGQMEAFSQSQMSPPITESQKKHHSKYNRTYSGRRSKSGAIGQGRVIDLVAMYEDEDEDADAEEGQDSSMDRKRKMPRRPGIEWNEAAMSEDQASRMMADSAFGNSSSSSSSIIINNNLKNSLHHHLMLSQQRRRRSGDSDSSAAAEGMGGIVPSSEGTTDDQQVPPHQHHQYTNTNHHQHTNTNHHQHYNNYNYYHHHHYYNLPHQEPIIHSAFANHQQHSHQPPSQVPYQYHQYQS